MYKFKLFIPFILLINIIFSLFGEEQTRIAVIDFQSIGVKDKYLAISFAENLRTSLTDITLFKVVERSDLIKAFNIQNLNLSDPINQETAIEIAKLTRADKVLTGTITKIGKTYTVNIRFSDINTAKLIFAKALRSPSLNELPLIIDKIVELITSEGKSDFSNSNNNYPEISEKKLIFRSDPNYSRLMFSPTGHALKKGDGYISNYYVFFPGISYGLSDKISIMAGMSILPGAGIGEQMKYFAPRLELVEKDNFALSIGTIYASFGEEFSSGLIFLVSTFGEHDKSFTTGLAFAYTSLEEETIIEDGEEEILVYSGKFRLLKNPIFMFGGNIRLSNNIALVSENWIFINDDFKLNQQPFGILVRFFGERLATDAGFVIVGKVLETGFPIPWLSFIYNFSK